MLVIRILTFMVCFCDICTDFHLCLQICEKTMLKVLNIPHENDCRGYCRQWLPIMPFPVAPYVNMALCKECFFVSGF